MGSPERGKMKEVIGAVVEVGVVQPTSSEAEFEQMKGEIEQKNLTLTEIESLHFAEPGSTP